MKRELKPIGLFASCETSLVPRLTRLFATRHPNRSNPIGFTVVEFLERKGNILKVKGVDMVDGTPVVAIKPYTSRDRKENIRTGWLEKEARSKA